jgi:pimeloyl-ACP methyl ester carboxylesterase
MLHPSEQIRFCQSRDGTRIAYAINGNGPPLLWAAHWAHHLKFDWDSPVWRPWLVMLSARHRLIRYDMRGCGLSDRDNVEISFERLFEDVEALVAAAGLQRFGLFGMASHTAVGMNYAVRHPERLSHLILYGARYHGRTAGTPSPQVIEEAETRIRMMELGWPDGNPAFGRFFTTLHMPDASPEQFRSFNELVRRTSSSANAAALLRAFFKIDVAEIIAKVSVPTLVLHARGEAIVDFDEGRQVAARIPGARLCPWRAAITFCWIQSQRGNNWSQQSTIFFRPLRRHRSGSTP